MINYNKLEKEIQDNYDDTDSLLEIIKDMVGDCGKCERFYILEGSANYGTCFLDADKESYYHISDYCSRFLNV